MKGNNGRGSRQRLKRKLGIFSCVVLLLLCFLYLTGIIASFWASFREYWRVWRVLDDNTPVDDPVWQDILLAHHHVSELSYFSDKRSDTKDQYSGYFLYFCRLEWDRYKQNPSHYAMYRFLVWNSPNCQTNLVKVPLRLAVDRIREFDQAHPGSVQQLKLLAAIFHESRCGSTLTANMLASMNPPKTRVYSESGPLIAALTQCDERYPKCYETLGMGILRDVMYIMMRSDDPQEERAFIKFPSYTTLHLDLFRQAFPHTPWMFVYRDPVQVMMSYFKHDPSLRTSSSCGPPYGFPGMFRDTIERHAHHRNPNQLSPTEICAAHLATLTETAAKALAPTSASGSDLASGIAVNYHDLPDVLWDEVLPNRIHLPLNADETQRMKACSHEYSKGWSKDRQYKYQDDAESKKKRASEEIKRAAETFLRESYVALEDANAQRTE